MIYDLINIGRAKFNGRVDVANETELLREVKKHLMSRDVDIIWNQDGMGIGTVTAGFHDVGIVKEVVD